LGELRPIVFAYITIATNVADTETNAAAPTENARQAAEHLPKRGDPVDL
jgi:hypothetical protein